LKHRWTGALGLRLAAIAGRDQALGGGLFQYLNIARKAVKPSL